MEGRRDDIKGMWRESKKRQKESRYYAYKMFKPGFTYCILRRVCHKY
jgi:hypothetical protein